MTAQPNWFVAEFDEDGRLLVSDDVTARLTARLGHSPQAGDQVTLAIIDEDVAPPDDDEAVERWLRSDVASSIDDAREHPEHKLSTEQVRSHFAERLAAAEAADA